MRSWSGFCLQVTTANLFAIRNRLRLGQGAGGWQWQLAAPERPRGRGDESSSFATGLGRLLLIGTKVVDYEVLLRLPTWPGRFEV